jgi:hypothetical protein
MEGVAAGGVVIYAPARSPGNCVAADADRPPRLRPAARNPGIPGKCLPWQCQCLLQLLQLVIVCVEFFHCENQLGAGALQLFPDCFARLLKAFPARG